MTTAYLKEEIEIWEQDLLNAPHGTPWHTSLHASAFPGDDHFACGRKALYGLMNIPQAEPFPAHVRAMGDAGKDIELQIIRRLAKAGILLSADQTDGDDVQTGFVDQAFWLTGNMDAVILPPKWKSPHVVEIKSKSHKVLEEMRSGRRGPDPEHRRQILTYIGLAHELDLHKRWYQKRLGPVKDGTLYYVSRDSPRTVHEFYFEYDAEFMAKGRERLTEWIALFKEAKLPERPKAWRWTEPPCRYCSVKKLCKADNKEKITDLNDSVAIAFAKQIRPWYDPMITRQAVLDRWDTNGRKVDGS